MFIPGNFLTTANFGTIRSALLMQFSYQYSDFVLAIENRQLVCINQVIHQNFGHIYQRTFSHAASSLLQDKVFQIDSEITSKKPIHSV